jgi:hypothetical protein
MISDAWSLAIQTSSSAYKKLQEANLNGSLKDQLDAWAGYQMAEDAREIATIEAGFGPAWPPRTELGLKYMGITREECNQMIVKFNSKKTSRELQSL